jgi:ribosomal protein L11 methyltransferase
MCLEEMERTVRPGSRVLDLGTGSGILAIGAARLGAYYVLALDTDAIAIRVATENVMANGVAHTVEVALGSLGPRWPFNAPDPTASFDLAVANIVASVILELAPDLVSALTPGGTLVAGGIIESRAEEVAQGLSRVGLQGLNRLEQADWVTLVGHKS